MLHATLRSLLSHKLRLALSGLAVVLGVAFVSGTMIFTDTLGKTFNNLFETTSADVNVLPASAFEEGFVGTGAGSAVSSVPESVVATVAAVDGVAAVTGDVQAEGVYLLKDDGTVLDLGGAPGIGINWVDDPRVSAATLTAGRAPSGAAEVAVDTGAAAQGGWEVGDTVSVLTPGPRVEATVVGLFRFGDSGGLAGASLTAFDTPTAQQLLTEPGVFTSISVAAEQGVAHEVLRDRVAQALGAGYDVTTAAERADDLASSFAEGLSFFNVFLLAFAAIALFVGTFIILNTFSMLVAQRSRELALLRALGASKRQVTTSVLAEALVLGVVGATLGLLGGFGIASGLRALFGSFGLTLDGSLVLAADTVVWAYVVGVVVTLLAAYLPARRAARTAPVAAMRDDQAMPERSLRRRTAAGAALAVTGLALLGAADAVDDGSSAATLVGAGALALVVGAIALSPVLARPFVRVVGSVLPRLFGSTGHLARENALRNPRRTAATASALMVGLALVSAFSIIGASTNASVDRLIDDALGADYVVSTAVGQPFTPELAAELRQLEGVGAVMQTRFGQGQLDGKPAFFTALDPATLDRALTLDYLAGSSAGLQGDGLIVDEPTAAARGWALGDQVELLLANGQTRTLEVGGIHKANQVIAPLSVSLETYTQTGGAALDRFVYVRLADGVDRSAVQPQLEQAVAAYPIVTLKDQGGFKDEQKAQVDQLLLLINALLVLSVLIAVLGIVNTLALSVIERTREIGLLRAIGMSRQQLRRMVRLESVVLSVYGATLGLVLGTVFGTSLTRALSGQGITELVVPGGRLLVLLGLAAVVGVLAAVWPARRAARLQVLDAIATT
jgi:putative ABC transport system permease protein